MKTAAPMLSGGVAACWCAALCLAGAATAAPATCDLRAVSHVNDVTRVELTFEAGGNLNIDRDGKTDSVPMSVNVQVSYEERVLAPAAPAAGPSSAIRSLRYYDEPKGTRQIGSSSPKIGLGQSRRLVAVKIDGGRATLFSPHDLMDRDELDMVEIPGNSLAVERLLPDKEVKVGESWSHADAVLAALLGVDHVERQDVKSTLLEVVGDVARIQLSGKVSGNDCGAGTEIELKAKYQYDLARKRITWMGLLVREHRKPGEVVPSFDVVARLQMQIAPQAASEHLSDAVVAGLAGAATTENTQLRHRSVDGLWTLTYDRNWYITKDDADVTVLKLLDQGECITQVNISSRPRVDPAKLISLERFKEDIRRSLDKNFGQFVESEPITTKANYRVYRVVVAGQVQEMAIQWRYYLLADRQGQQLVLAFVCRAEMVERLKDWEPKLVDAIRLLAPQVAEGTAAQKSKGPEAHRQPGVTK